MDIQFKIDPEAGVIYTVASGTIGAKEIETLRENVLSDPRYHSELNVIADFRNAEVKFSGEEARRMAFWDKDRKMVKKIGVVARQGFAFFRMYQGWVDSGPELSVFEDMDSAREWLDLPREDNP